MKEILKKYIGDYPRLVENMMSILDELQEGAFVGYSYEDYEDEDYCYLLQDMANDDDWHYTTIYLAFDNITKCNTLSGYRIDDMCREYYQKKFEKTC